MKRPSKAYMEDKTWEEKAKENPLYGVMSHEEFVNTGSEPTSEELERFYSRGYEMVSQWINPWLSETKTSADMKILEFGCGMGRLTNALAKDRNPETIFGIDISKTMIDHAIKNTVRGSKYSVIGDNGDFPYESNYFDRIYSYAVFQHISEKTVIEKSIKEIARVLKPGGKVKLNFEMVFCPPFENHLKQDTYAFNNSYFTYGWKIIYGIPVWGAKLYKSNNWSGIRLGYKQLLKVLEANGIRINGIVGDSENKSLIWFLGEKIT